MFVCVRTSVRVYVYVYVYMYMYVYVYVYVFAVFVHYKVAYSNSIQFSNYNIKPTCRYTCIGSLFAIKLLLMQNNDFMEKLSVC